MFIEVAKIVKDHKKVRGTRVVNPVSTLQPEEFKVVMETIRRDEIKSVRRWHKSFGDEEVVEGDITVLYLFAGEMRINETYESFIERLGVVKVYSEIIETKNSNSDEFEPSTNGMINVIKMVASSE